MMDEGYTIHSQFDIDKHKKTFINYLEVIIHEDGTVHYGVPSHQEYLVRLACRKLACSREHLDSLCPQEWWVDFMRWLCGVTNSVAVWNTFIEYYTLNDNQIKTLEQLKAAGLLKYEKVARTATLPPLYSESEQNA